MGYVDGVIRFVGVFDWWFRARGLGRKRQECSWRYLCFLLGFFVSGAIGVLRILGAADRFCHLLEVTAQKFESGVD